MNIVVDIGNTLCKAAVFDGDCLIEEMAVPLSLTTIDSILERFPGASKMFCSTAQLRENESQYFAEKGFLNVFEVPNMPLISDYQSQGTLGGDRWAAVCGASFISGQHFPLMVIQAGTAITFDYVDGNGHFVGGAISPGISLRLRALHNFTGKLPLIEPSTEFKRIGSTTHESILSGVMTGCLAEIQNRIAEFRNIHAEAYVYVAGGDSRYFDLSPEKYIFAVPNIVLVGLNYLLNLNK